MELQPYLRNRMVRAILLITLMLDQTRATDVHYINEARLQRDIFDGYIPHVRPVLSHNTPVKVKVFPTIIRIEQINEKSDVLSTTMSLTMEWKDPRLSWIPSIYGNITYTYVPLKGLWRPDISLQNAAPVLEDNDGRLLARVSSVGTVLVTSHRQLHSYCAFDLTHFPRDIQTCTLKFGSWMYSAEQLLLSFFNPDRTSITVKLWSDRTEGSTDTDTDSQYWALVDRTAVAAIERVYYGSPYDVLKLTLRIQRLSNDIIILATPLIITSLLVPIQFLIPATSKQRSIFGVMVLVNLLILLQTIFVFIPSGHSTVPRIATWYLGNMACSVIGVICSTFTTIISYRRSPMPSSDIRKFTQRFQAIMCISTSPQTNDLAPDQVALLINGNTKFSRNTGSVDSPVRGSDVSAMGQLENIMMLKQNKKVLAEETSKHWREFSCVLDRFFFILFCMLFIANLFIFI